MIFNAFDLLMFCFGFLIFEKLLGDIGYIIFDMFVKRKRPLMYSASFGNVLADEFLYGVISVEQNFVSCSFDIERNMSLHGTSCFEAVEL